MSQANKPSLSDGIPKTNKKSLLALAFVLLLVGVDFGKLDHFYSYVGDSQFKLVQSYSLLHSDFQSEEIYYPNRAIDPQYQLYPISAAYKVQINRRHLGAFPIALSYITALLLKLSSLKILPIFFMILSLGVFAILSWYYEFPVLLIFFSGLGTPLLLYGYEISEHPVLLAFQLLGLILFQNPRREIQFTSGFLIGATSYFRLEGLVFAFFFAFYLICLDFWNTRNLKIILYRRFSFLSAMCLAILALLIFNYWDYGHIFGPRYIVNVSYTPFSAIAQLKRAFVLLFFGHYKLGFFGFSPLFLIIIPYILVLHPFRELPQFSRVLLLASVSLMAVVLATAPNDGGINWGSRYLNLALIPLLILSKPFFVNASTMHFSKKILVWLLFLFSMFMFSKGVRIYHAAYKQLNSYQKEFLATGSQNILMQVEPLVYHAGAMVLTHNFMNPRSDEAVEILLKGSKEGRWPDLVYIEPLPPKNMSGLAGEVFQKTLLGPKQQRIRQKIWEYFQVSNTKELKHIRVYYLKRR